jgi:DNA-binding CsgD family transcriptional regulator
MMRTRNPADIEGELWTVDQCCQYWGAKRGRPLARTTWFDYVRKGYAPKPEPVILPGTNARAWDSAKVIAAEQARVGFGRSVDRVEWVAARDTSPRRQFWRGPDHPDKPVTNKLANAAVFKSQRLVQQALQDAFGPGNRWGNPKWGGFEPMRRTAALLDENPPLSEQQLFVLRKVARGATHQAIADELGVTRQRVGQIEHDALRVLTAEREA